MFSRCDLDLWHQTLNVCSTSGLTRSNSTKCELNRTTWPSYRRLSIFCSFFIGRRCCRHVISELECDLYQIWSEAGPVIYAPNEDFRFLCIALFRNYRTLKAKIRPHFEIFDPLSCKIWEGWVKCLGRNEARPSSLKVEALAFRQVSLFWSVSPLKWKTEAK